MREEAVDGFMSLRSQERERTKGTALSPPLSATCKCDKCISGCSRGKPDLRRVLGKVTFKVPSHQFYDRCVHPSLLCHVAHKQMMADNVKNIFEIQSRAHSIP